MGVVTIEREISMSVPHTSMLNFFAPGNHHQIPKIVPHVSVETLQGNGGPGTIKKATFNAPGSDIKYVKIREESTTGNVIRYTIIEAEPWSDKLEKITVEVKVEASSNGGSAIKTCTKYVPKPNCVLDEAEINANAEKIMGLYKVFEGHILTNPNALN